MWLAILTLARSKSSQASGPTAKPLDNPRMGENYSHGSERLEVRRLEGPFPTRSCSAFSQPLCCAVHLYSPASHVLRGTVLAFAVSNKVRW